MIRGLSVDVQPKYFKGWAGDDVSKPTFYQGKLVSLSFLKH